MFSIKSEAVKRSLLAVLALSVTLTLIINGVVQKKFSRVEDSTQEIQSQVDTLENQTEELQNQIGELSLSQEHLESEQENSGAAAKGDGTNVPNAPKAETPEAFTVIYSGGVATGFGGSFRFSAKIAEDPAGEYVTQEAADESARESISRVRVACEEEGDMLQAGYQPGFRWIDRVEGPNPLPESCINLFLEKGLPVGETIPESVMEGLYYTKSVTKVKDFLVVYPDGQIIGRVPSNKALESGREGCWKAGLVYNGYGPIEDLLYVDVRFFDSEEGEDNALALYAAGFHNIQQPTLPDFCGYLGMREVAEEDHAEVFNSHGVRVSSFGSGKYFIAFESRMEAGGVTMTGEGNSILVEFDYDGSLTSLEYDRDAEKSWIIDQGALVNLEVGYEDLLVTLSKDGELVVFLPVDDTWSSGTPVVTVSPCVDGLCPYHGTFKEASGLEAFGAYYNLSTDEVVRYDPTVVEIK
jgi:hypothetical protein